MNYRVQLLNDVRVPLGGFDGFNGHSFLTGANVSDPHAIIVRSDKINTDDYLELLVVARAGAGVNNISIEAATKRGIAVFNTPGANANAVKELVFAAIYMVARNMTSAIAFVRDLAIEGSSDADISAKVEKNKRLFVGTELSGKTMVVIGLGAVGVRVANAALEKGLTVVGFDPSIAIANAHQLDRRVEIAKRLPEALSRADVLSIHVPLSTQTRHLIDAANVGLLRKGCIVANYAREGICDDSAVIAAIKSGHLGGYASDFPTRKLIDMMEGGKVVCTPHLGASTAQSEEKCAAMAVQAVEEYCVYGTTVNSVNFPIMDVRPRPTTKTRILVINRNVPNMIGQVTTLFGSLGINIENMVNEGNDAIGYNAIDCDREIPRDIASKLAEIDGVISCRVLNF